MCFLVRQIESSSSLIAGFRRRIGDSRTRRKRRGQRPTGRPVGHGSSHETIRSGLILGAGIPQVAAQYMNACHVAHTVPQMFVARVKAARPQEYVVVAGADEELGNIHSNTSLRSKWSERRTEPPASSSSALETVPRSASTPSPCCAKSRATSSRGRSHSGH